MTTPPSPDDQVLAAEFVLRLLDEDTRHATYARMRDDPDFASLVLEWRETFGRMDDQFEDETPNRAIKTAIMLHLFGSKTQRAPRWLDRLTVWQFATAAFFAMTVGLGTLLYTQSPAPTATLYVAELASEGDSLRILAVYNEASNQVRVTRTAGQSLPDRSLQLWAISGDNPPVSIGVLPASSEATLSLPLDLSQSLDGLVLAISDEPIAGSPTGQPTGEVLAVSAISKL